MPRVYLGNLRGPQGFSVTSSLVNLDGDLIVTYSNGAIRNAGRVRGPQGLPGVDALPADEAVAAYVSTAGASQTQSALDRRYQVMAPPPNGVDDTPVLQPLLLRAQSSGVPLQLQRGKYRHTGLMTATSFDQPIIRGFGRNLTELEGPAGISGIVLRGGSGGMSGGVIEDLTISSVDGTGTGIEFRGCGGVNGYRLLFTKLARGVLFNNTGAGQFTEFCVIHDSEMSTSVVTKAQFSRGSGNDSFHGSGFRNTILNQVASATNDEIIIGADCRWYNAPLDVTWFGRSEGTSLVRNKSNLNANTFGDIRTETSATKTHTLYAFDAGVTGRHVHGGHIAHLSQGVSLGSGFRMANRTQQSNDGSSTSMDLPTESTGVLAPGANTVASFSTPGTTFMVTVEIWGSGFERTGVFVVTRARGENTIGMSQVGTWTRLFDSAGIGTVTVTASGNAIVVTGANFPATGFQRRVTMTPLQGRSQLPLI